VYCFSGLFLSFRTDYTTRVDAGDGINRRGIRVSSFCLRFIPSVEICKGWMFSFFELDDSGRKNGFLEK
jgi:hypothetical protein